MAVEGGGMRAPTGPSVIFRAGMFRRGRACVPKPVPEDHVYLLLQRHLLQERVHPRLLAEHRASALPPQAGLPVPGAGGAARPATRSAAEHAKAHRATEVLPFICRVLLLLLLFLQRGLLNFCQVMVSQIHQIGHSITQAVCPVNGGFVMRSAEIVWQNYQTGHSITQAALHVNKGLCRRRAIAYKGQARGKKGRHGGLPLRGTVIT